MVSRAVISSGCIRGYVGASVFKESIPGYRKLGNRYQEDQHLDIRIGVGIKQSTISSGRSSIGGNGIGIGDSVSEGILSADQYQRRD